MATKPHLSASLYVGDSSPDVTEGLLGETFNRVGQVASIRVCRDTLTKRSLLYAYVNFVNVVDAERALDTLNNQLIKGKPCRIMWSQRDPSIRKSGVGNIFIKNLDPSVGHKELYDTFSAFGNILSCKVATNEYGQSKGFGFVHFEGSEAAEEAIKTVNEKLLKTKQVYVGKFVSKKERLKLKEASWTNVYVKDIDPEVTDEDFRGKFGEFGAITSAVIMRNENTSRGFGFVNYENHESALKAVQAMHTQTLGNKKLWCSRAQKKSEREAELKKTIQQKKLDRISKFQGINLYIKNLEDEIDESRLRQEFSAFGTIRSVKIMTDDKGNSRGFGFICYSSPEEAARAISEMNSRILHGFTKPLYVAQHEPKEFRRSKLAQRQAARKIRPMPAQPPLPQMSYPPPNVYYGNGNAPHPYLYQQQMPRRAPAWPQNQPYAPVPVMPQQPQMRGGGRNPNARSGPSGASGRGRNIRRSQAPPPENTSEDQLQRVLLLPPESQKVWLGEALYPRISLLEPERCAKITGMLLDSEWSVEDLFSLIEDPEKLGSKVQEAVRVLEQSAIAHKGTEDSAQN
jgi:polyadenylate-binding protein